MAISQHGTSVLFTSHPQDGLVVNFYILHNRRTPLQAEEALGPISIPQGSHGVDPFRRTSASREEKPGAYSTPGTPFMRGVVKIEEKSSTFKKVNLGRVYLISIY